MDTVQLEERIAEEGAKFFSQLGRRRSSVFSLNCWIEKMMNWCFNRGDLRGWGVITGDWGAKDMDGLIGEVNASAPDYVFNMNSLEHVGALVPAVRYDDRFATAIAKWALNTANASRFYYSEFLPDRNHD